MVRGQPRSRRVAIRAGISLALVVLVLAAWPTAPGFAAGPASLELEVSTGTHGPLPQAARLTYRIRVRNAGTADAPGVTVAQELPGGVAPLGTPALGGASTGACVVVGSAGPDGATRFRASCDVGTLRPGGGAVMVVRARVDRRTCGTLATSATAAVDGVRRAAVAHTDRVVCACGVRLARDVTRAGAVGSDAILRLTVRNPGPHTLRYELRGGGHRLSAGVLPSRETRQLRHTLHLGGPRTTQRIVVLARAPDGRSCRAAGTVVILATATSPPDVEDRTHGGGTAFTGSPGATPVWAAIALLLLGLASLAAARRRAS